MSSRDPDADTSADPAGREPASQADTDTGTGTDEPRTRVGVVRRMRSELRAFFSADLDDPMAGTEDRQLRQACTLGITLTLLIVLVGAPPSTHAFTPFVAIAGIAASGLQRNPWYWILLVGLFALSPLQRPWLELDNHHWLQLYWVAAIMLSRFAVRPDEVLRRTARLLIGLAFLFAVVWKLLAPDFADGSFFDATFATDRRLGEVAAAFGLQEPGITGQNRAVITRWIEPGTTPQPGEIVTSPTVTRITPLLAWLTILVELSVAVAFLAPLARRWRWLRDATLLVFVVATYPLAPVVGFGQLLVAMSVVQSELRARLRAFIYIATFIGIGLLRERRTVLDFVERLLGVETG